MQMNGSKRGSDWIFGTPVPILALNRGVSPSESEDPSKSLSTSPPFDLAEI